MALHLIAEALLRIEHKLDALLKHLKVPVGSMQFMSGPCPACKQLVEFQLDLTHNVAKRKCGCSSGKQPSLFPITQIGEGNVREASNSSSDRARDRSSDPDR